MEIKVVNIDKPDEMNFIMGHSHFIKTVEDLYEAVVQSVPGIKFGIAFCEASGKCLILHFREERITLGSLAGNEFLFTFQPLSPDFRKSLRHSVYSGSLFLRLLTFEVLKELPYFEPDSSLFKYFTSSFNVA